MCAEAGAVGLGQLEAVALVVAPAAQEDRLALARLDLHAEHVLEEAQARLGLRREQLGVADVRDVVQASRRPPRARAGRRGRRRARRPRAGPACRARFSARSRAAASTSSTRSRATTTAPSASSTTASPGADRRAADLDRLVERARPPSWSAPLTRTQRAQTGTPSSRRSSMSRTAASTSSAATPRALACVASSSPISATGAGSGIVSTSTSPGWARVHRGVDHQVVALAAAHGARRPGGARARDHAVEVQVDQSLAAGRLVDGRAAQGGELVASLTARVSTCGSTRMNASA